METEQTVNKETNNLQKRLERKDEELFDATRFFNLCIVETTPDMKIINIYGDSDYVFLGVQGILKVQSNITSVVQKLTGKNGFKNQENGNQNSNENSENKDDEDETGYYKELKNFNDSPKQEKNYNIISTNNNQNFMLKWSVKKQEGRIKHFFQRIDIESLITDVKEQNENDINNLKNHFKQVMDHVTDGIVILDDHNKIEFLNETTRNHLMNSNKNQLFKKMNLEGKNYNEVFIIDEPEFTKKKIDINNEVFQSGKPKTYILEENEKEVIYKVIPLKSADEIEGIGIISSIKNDDPFGGKVDIKKVMFTLKKYTEDNKVMTERIKELENNHNWFMKNQKNYQQTIKTLYFYLEKLPVAFSIQELPSEKYIFINRKMEDKINKKRDSVLGKLDNEIYEGEIVETMELAISEGMLGDEDAEKEYEVNDLKFLQKVLYQNMAPTHLIRVFKD